jgi:hypothetical protein
MSNQEHVRREKIDPADGLDTKETFLPGQIPVAEADSAQSDEARKTEQQPDPVAAEEAVNPVDLAGVRQDKSKIQHPELQPAEDRNTGE